MFHGAAWYLLTTVVVCYADKIRFPGEEAAASVRIDNKVRFIDKDNLQNRNPNIQSDEVPFQQPTDTEGFYNRPPGVGKYPVRITNHHYGPDLFDRGAYESDGTLDSLEYCKCVSTPECNPRPNSKSACGNGKFLCCYKRTNQPNQQNSEVFNEVDDERPVLLPGRQILARPFPPPPGTELNNEFGPGHAHNAGILGNIDRADEFIAQGGLATNSGHHGVLVGPEGPTGIIGPAQPTSGVLVGPGGPTGIIGPNYDQRQMEANGQNFILPNQSAQQGILVGPGGPTGIIGPAFNRRPVLVGPGGPTGIIGPNNRGVLVGPGGPTGIIGPGYNRQRPGYGVAYPGRQILVGSGGPTGHIGPQYYGKK